MDLVHADPFFMFVTKRVLAHQSRLQTFNNFLLNKFLSSHVPDEVEDFIFTTRESEDMLKNIDSAIVIHVHEGNLLRVKILSSLGRKTATIARKAGALEYRLKQYNIDSFTSISIANDLKSMFAMKKLLKDGYIVTCAVDTRTGGKFRNISKGIMEFACKHDVPVIFSKMVANESACQATDAPPNSSGSWPGTIRVTGSSGSLDR